MQNKLALILLFLPLLVSFVAAQDLSSLLAKAEKLKYAEKYQAAEKLYDDVLKIEPNNLEAQKGKQDCRLMLEPVIPEQHIMVTEIDAEYKELIEKCDAAKTPWDKRRAEIAIDRYAVKYTGKVFGEQSKMFEQEADKIIARFKDNPSALALSNATDQLKQLQERAHRSWKGHGPEILEPALLRLRENLRNSMLQ